MDNERTALVSKTLDEFSGAARSVLEDTLVSIVLYGSAAEDQLRPTSDVNLILVLTSFDAPRMEKLREPFRKAHALIDLNVLYLAEGEISAAIAAFAEKFADVLRRRRVLFGPDPFAGGTVPRDAEIARLRQVLLNSILRMRAIYVSRGLREEQLARAVADAAGPLRSDAAAILELRGERPGSPKLALARLASELAKPDEHDWEQVLGRISEVREQHLLAPGLAGATLLRLIDLSERMLASVRAIEGRTA